MKKNKPNRRIFLRQAAGAALGAAAFPYVVSSSAMGAGGAVAPSDRITVGGVGVGSRGTAVLRNFLAEKDVQVVAVCDVKSNVLKDRQNLVNKHYNNTGCRAYGDFQEVMARDDIDVILAAPPDHWHVLVALAAVKSGKDVYLEKPMSLSLAQDQALRSAVHRNGRIFQFGTQQRSGRNFRFACELALNGKLGELHTINVWSPGSSQGGDPTPVPVPAWLDYERWLGPAPFTPYTKDRCSNKLWWFISDYALGFIAGWGIHPIDIAFWGGGKKVTTPLTIEGKGKWPTSGVADTALDWNIVMKYDSGLTMNFTGPNFPEDWRKRYGRTTSHGTAFEGADGWVHVDRSGINAHPKELLTTEFGPSDIRLPESNNHVRNLLDSVKTRAKTVANIDDAVQSDILCHISDIAIRLEQKLRWDPKAERFVNNDAANRRLTRPMRSPWTI